MIDKPFEVAAPDRLDALRAIVEEVLELDPGELTLTGSFIEDHGADSLMGIEILACIERDFGIDVPQEELPRMTDLQSTYDVIAPLAGWEPADA
jgi:acyl carrier protein